MENNWEKIVKFVKKNRIGIYISILVVLLGYGFAMTNASIGTDDTAGDMYFSYGYSLRMSRLFMPLLNKFFDVLQFTPFWTELLAVTFLLVSAWLMVFVLEERLNKEISTILGAGFVCVFLSYSLINEIFIYSYMSVSIGLGYFFTSLAIYYYNRMQKESKHIKLKLFGYAVLLMIVSVSLYESFVAVFLCLVGIELYVEYQDKKVEFRNILINLFYAVGMCLSAVILERLIARSLILFWKLENLNVASNTSIIWLESNFVDGIKSLMRTLFYDQFIAGFEYLPILFLVVVMIFLTVNTVIKVFKRKNYLLLLLWGWIFVLAELIVFIQGQTFYRSCQTFGLVVALGFTLFGKKLYDVGKRKWVVYFFLILVIVQTQDLSNWFYLNHRRHEVETALTSSLVVDMKKDGLYGKRIAFVYDTEKIREFDHYRSYTSFSAQSYLRKGINNVAKRVPILNTPELQYEVNRRHNQTNCLTTYLEYGVNAFQDSFVGPNYELKKVLEEYFFHFEQVTWEEWEKAKKEAEKIESYPSNTYYMDMGEYYIVKVGI